MAKFRIGVFMGGRSLEKEVSFNSGRTVCDHLDSAKYDIVPIFQTDAGILYILPLKFLHRGKIDDFKSRLKKEAQTITWDDIAQLIDLAYLAVHGRNGEDGALQGMLEMLKIPYLGSKILGSALGMNKAMQKDVLSANGINVPNGIIIETYKALEAKNFKQTILKKIKEANLVLPLVVKPEAEGSSIGVRIVEKEDELLDAITNAASINPKIKQRVIVEEKINGMEVTCIVITDNKAGNLLPTPPTEVVPEEGSTLFDYEQKYMPGRAQRFTPARCSEINQKRIQNVAIKTMKVLGITNIGRIDVFLKKNGKIVVFDPNSLSGMGPSFFLFKQAAEIGINHTQLINHFIETELLEYGICPIINEDKNDAMNKPKIKVGIILGGRNSEREISLESGRNITYKLSLQKYQALPLFLDSNLNLYQLTQKMLVCNTTTEIENEIKRTKAKKISWSNLSKLIDFAFIALHGDVGENGTMQGTLQMLNIPYNGSDVLTSALCTDKYKTNQFLAQNNFDTPKNYLINKEEWQKNKKNVIEKIKQTFSCPLIIKPHNDGCSFIVQKATNQIEIEPFIENVLQKHETALIEEFVKGMELTVGCIGNDQPHAFTPSYTIASQNILSIKEKFLPGAGENQTPAPISDEAISFVKKTIEECYKTLNCKGYCRIDCFYQEPSISPTNNHRLIILEINTLPGMTPATCIFHQAAEEDINPMEFIDLIIQLGLEQHQKTNLIQKNATNKKYRQKTMVKEKEAEMP